MVVCTFSLLEKTVYIDSVSIETSTCVSDVLMDRFNSVYHLLLSHAYTLFGWNYRVPFHVFAFDHNVQVQKDPSRSTIVDLVYFILGIELWTDHDIIYNYIQYGDKEIYASNSMTERVKAVLYHVYDPQHYKLESRTCNIFDFTECKLEPKEFVKHKRLSIVDKNYIDSSECGKLESVLKIDNQMKLLSEYLSSKKSERDNLKFRNLFTTGDVSIFSFVSEDLEEYYAYTKDKLDASQQNQLRNQQYLTIFLSKNITLSNEAAFIADFLDYKDAYIKKIKSIASFLGVPIPRKQLRALYYQFSTDLGSKNKLTSILGQYCEKQNNLLFGWVNEYDNKLKNKINDLIDGFKQNNLFNIQYPHESAIKNYVKELLKKPQFYSSNIEEKTLSFFYDMITRETISLLHDRLNKLETLDADIKKLKKYLLVCSDLDLEQFKDE